MSSSSLLFFYFLDEFLYFNKIESRVDPELYEGRRWAHCDHQKGSPVCQIRDLGARRANQVFSDFSRMTSEQKSDLIPRMVLSREGGVNKYMIDNLPVCIKSFKYLVQLSPTTIGKYASNVRESRQGKHDNRNQIDRDKFKLWIEGPADQLHGPGAIGPSHCKYAESQGHLLYTHNIQYLSLNISPFYILKLK